MPIRFVCPNCGNATDVADHFAGQTGPCASCGKPITIPLPTNENGQPHQRTAIKLLIFLAVAAMVVPILAVLAFVFLPMLSADKDLAHRAQCVQNLKQIAQAMLQYESANGCFPPAYVADKHGKRLYSWRVLLLPYLDQGDLADRFRLDEPWNSPANRAVTDVAIGLYQCPSQPGANGPTTNYMMVVGPHTISDGREPRRIAEIADGLKDTIAVVEVADSNVCWAAPEDLHFDRLTFAVNGGRRQEISSDHRHGVNVAFCDGSVRFLKNSTNPQLVKAMLTIDGGEKTKLPD